jgi:hypothetical protein
VPVRVLVHPRLKYSNCFKILRKWKIVQCVKKENFQNKKDEWFGDNPN